MNLKTAIAIILLLFPLAAQQDSTKNTFSEITSNVYNDVKLSLENILSFYTAPGHFTGTDWLITSAIIPSTYGLMHADQNVYNSYIRSRGDRIFNNSVYRAITQYGKITYANGLGAVIYLTGLLAKEDYLKITGRVMLEGLFISGFTAITLRTFFGRSRPFYEPDPWKFNWFVFNKNMDGFPSGHTTVAFAFSTILAERIDNNWVRVLYMV